MKVIVVPRLQFFINSSITKALFPFNSIPTKNTILIFLWKKGRVVARTDRIPEYTNRCFERTKDKTK